MPAWGAEHLRERTVIVGSVLKSDSTTAHSDGLTAHYRTEMERKKGLQAALEYNH